MNLHEQHIEINFLSGHRSLQVVQSLGWRNNRLHCSSGSEGLVSSCLCIRTRV